MASPATLRRRRAAAAPPAAPPDFWAALAGWVLADADLAAAFPGGVAVGTAAPLQAYPYLRLWDDEGLDPTSPQDMEARVLASAYALDADAGPGDVRAADAAKLLARKLTTAAGRPDLPFTHLGEPWREAGMIWVPPAKLRQLPDGRGGAHLWRYDLTFLAFLVSDADGADA